MNEMKSEIKEFKELLRKMNSAKFFFYLLLRKQCS